jgi:predicted enzyme related to lactoylglutathione lyase
VGNPVVHFEIIGTDPQNLRDYYRELFGWEFDISNPVSDAVSEPDSYGFVGRIASPDGSGIPGGVGGGENYPPQALFYVGVEDVEQALRDAERHGGARVLGPTTSPSGLVIGQFTDPAGNLIGVAGVAGD